MAPHHEPALLVSLALVLIEFIFLMVLIKIEMN